MGVHLRGALSGELVAEISIQQSQGLLAVCVSTMNRSHACLVSRSCLSVQTRFARTSKGGAASSLFLGGYGKLGELGFVTGEGTLGIVNSGPPGFDEAISINPSYLEMRINLELVLSQNSDPAGAANVCREILKQNPDRAEIHNNLGLVLMQMKDSKAEACFKEALRLKPDYADAQYNLALALLQTGREKESNSEFAKAYQLAPQLRTTAEGAPGSHAPDKK